MARDRAGDWFEPAGAAPSTHAFKPGVPAYRDQALNEHVCLQAARTLGLNAVISEFLDFDGQSALVVARYDRRRQAGSEDVLRFVEAVAFTYLIRAPDAHAKYYSVLNRKSVV